MPSNASDIYRPYVAGKLQCKLMGDMRTSCIWRSIEASIKSPYGGRFDQ